MFEVDARILSTSVWLYDDVLSSVYLKNDTQFLWFILVPRVPDASELFHLSKAQSMTLMEELTRISTKINALSKPDKLNIGALGNMVSQLHIHIVARFKDDAAWPHGIWQPNVTSKLYSETALLEQVNRWRGQLDDQRQI